MLVRKELIDDLLADSQYFAKEEDGGHGSDHSISKRNKVGEPVPDIVASIPGIAIAAAMPLAVVPPALKEEGFDVGLMMQQNGSYATDSNGEPYSNAADLYWASGSMLSDESGGFILSVTFDGFSCSKFDCGQWSSCLSSHCVGQLGVDT